MPEASSTSLTSLHRGLHMPLAPPHSDGHLARMRRFWSGKFGSGLLFLHFAFRFLFFWINWEGPIKRERKSRSCGLRSLGSRREEIQTGCGQHKSAEMLEGIHLALNFSKLESPWGHFYFSCGMEIWRLSFFRSRIEAELLGFWYFYQNNSCFSECIAPNEKLRYPFSFLGKTLPPTI